MAERNEGFERNVGNLFRWNVTEAKAPIGTGIQKLGKASDEKNNHPAGSNQSKMSLTVAKIIDEIIFRNLRYGVVNGKYLCEYHTEYASVESHDLVYFDRNQRTSKGKLQLTGGMVMPDGNISPYDLEMRSTSVLGALMPIFLDNEEFARLYNSYKTQREIFFKDNDITNTKCVCNEKMTETANEELILLADNAYRRLINDAIEVGLDIKVAMLFKADSIFTDGFASQTGSPFACVQNESEKFSAVNLPIFSNPFAIEYSEEEKAMIPCIDNYVMSQEIEDIYNMIVRGGVRNIIIFGSAGTGKSLMAKKLAQLLGLPFLSQSMTAETETLDVIGKIIPRTGKVDQRTINQKIDAILSEQTPYICIPDLAELQYGTSSDLYYDLTGEVKEDATRVEVMDAYTKAIAFKTKQELRIGMVAETATPDGFDFVDSPILQSARYGYMVEVEEGNLANVFSGVNSLFDMKRGYIALETGETIQRHPNFITIMTMNPECATRSLLKR